MGIDGIAGGILEQHAFPEEGPIAIRTNEPKAFRRNVFNFLRIVDGNEAEFFELCLFERAALGLHFAELL